VIGLQSKSYYTDGASSHVDAERYAEEQAAAKPLNDLLRLVERSADEYRRGKAGAAACALAALDAWAQADALLGDFSTQGAYQRKWTLAGAALAYLSFRDAPGLSSAAKARVARWMGEVGRAVRPYYERPPTSAHSDKRNNHAYWAGLAVAAAGLADGDRDMVAWGVSRLRLGLADVTAEGALPAELARKRMALHYHLFSLPPLAALARIGEVNGMGLSAEERAALDRLARFTYAATQDPTRIASLAGEAQDDPMLRGRPALTQAVGLELWLLTQPGGAASAPEIAAALQPSRPYRTPWLGGDVAALWAAR
jgi:poly(beta-D-mannuronate) lyase